MSSTELLEVINMERVRFGEEPVRRNDFAGRVAHELAGDDYETIVVRNHNGTFSTTYQLTVDQCMLVAMRESRGVRRNVLAALKESEAKSSGFLIPRTLSEALRLAADQADVIAAQTEALALAAPKVEFVDRYVQAATGAMTFRQVCKMLAVKEPVFRKFLSDHGVMYRLGSDWAPYSQHLDAGRFKTTAGVAEHGDSSHAYTQAKFTSKGVEWIAAEWAKHQVTQHRATMCAAQQKVVQ